MDALRRADRMLARIRARHADVVTPDSATSPMDADATMRIPRVPAAEPDVDDPDSTLVLPRFTDRRHDGQQRGGQSPSGAPSRSTGRPGSVPQTWMNGRSRQGRHSD